MEKVIDTGGQMLAACAKLVPAAPGHALFCTCAKCVKYWASMDDLPDQESDIGSDIEREADDDAHFAPVHNYGW